MSARGLNLHNVVRAAISGVHPDETLTYYQSTGQKNAVGRIKAVYAEPATVTAQVQADGDAALAHVERTGQNTQIIRAYLYADTWNAPAGIVRPFSRNGDVFSRANGTWWQVIGVPDNFEGVEWVCIHAALMTVAPDFSACDWYEAETEESE